jgi:hypothetical protein
LKAWIYDGQFYVATAPARNASNSKIFMKQTARRGSILNEVIILKQAFYPESFHD